MKKTLLIVILVIIAAVIYFVLLEHQQLKNNASGSFKSSVPPKVTAEDKSCSEVDNLIIKLSGNIDDDSYTLTTLIHKDAFIQLEKTALINNKCGADAASFLVRLYSRKNMPEQSKKYHQKVINYANSNNISAISNLCDGYDSLTNSLQQLYFCQIVLDDSSQKFGDTVKFAALTTFSSFYFKSNQGNKLFELCEKIDDNKDICMFSFLFTSVNSLAYKFYEEKNYEEAFKLYKKIEPYDVTGLTQSQLGIMYQNGEGVVKNLPASILWYKKAVEKNYNPKIRSEILNNLGVAYEEQLNYHLAFERYHQAAIMGYSLSQMNLALMYLKGYGTIQNNQQAYAWISIAISKGLDGREKQKQAEKIKNILIHSLREQDETGTALRQAEFLAQQYYKKYLLQEKPTTNNNKNIKTKIKES